MWYRFKAGGAEKKKKKKTTTIAGSTAPLPSLSSLTSSARLLSSRSCLTVKPTILRPLYGMGMWRVVSILACLTVTNAAVFTEGGAVLNGGHQRENSPNSKNFDFDLHKELEKDKLYDQDFEKYMKTLANEPIEEEAQASLESNEPTIEEQEYLQYILGMMENGRLRQEAQTYQPDDDFPLTEELPVSRNENNKKVESTKQQQVVKAVEKQHPKNTESVKAQQQPQPRQEQQKTVDDSEAKMDEYLKELDELQIRLDREAKNTAPVKVGNEKEWLNQESVEGALPAAVGEPQVPQKKGQNEFVSFVEPDEQKVMKNTKSAQTIDKRRLTTSADYSSNSPKYSSSSLLLLAVGTVLSVGVVGTVAGGAYYLKRKNDTPDDGEYAPYAGTGPGFKKNKGSQGDETLAYKAQLHQYQQAKQKIICGEDAPGIIESDGEDGVDEENNFSVYECPGLAPTGDIEVCNPNFAAQQ